MEIKINGPKYLGDKNVVWQEDMINESSFVHEMRVKSWWTEDNKLYWVTQEDFTHYEFEEFMLELERYFKVTGQNNIEVYCTSRDLYPLIREKGQISIDK